MIRTAVKDGVQFTMSSADLLKAVGIETGELFDLWQEPMTGRITIVTRDLVEYDGDNPR